MDYDAVQWAGRDLRGATLTGAKLRGANLLGCRLDDADLREADLRGANLALSSMRRADLRDARVAFTSFAGADLRGARLPFDLSACDLGGAHLACVDFDRRRRLPTHVLARARGYPSFADALEFSSDALSMRFTLLLLAVDAALDTSRDPDAELAALTREEEWTRFGVGAVGVARSGRVAASAANLWRHVEQNQHGLSAGAALVHTGVASRDEVVGRRASQPWVNPVDARASLERILENIAAWPDPSAQPPPRRP